MLNYKNAYAGAAKLKKILIFVLFTLITFKVFAASGDGQINTTGNGPSISEISGDIQIDERKTSQTSGWRQLVSKNESKIDHPFVSDTAPDSKGMGVKEYLGVGISLGGGYLNFGSGAAKSVNLDLNLYALFGREFFPYNRFFLKLDLSLLNSPISRITPFSAPPSSSTSFMVEAGYTFVTEYISFTAYFGGGFLNFSSSDNRVEHSIAFITGGEIDFTVGMEESDGAAMPIHIILPLSYTFNANHSEIKAGIGFLCTIEPGRRIWASAYSSQSQSSTTSKNNTEVKK